MPNRKFANAIGEYVHAIGGVRGGVRKVRRARFCFPLDRHPSSPTLAHPSSAERVPRDTSSIPSPPSPPRRRVARDAAGAGRRPAVEPRAPGRRPTPRTTHARTHPRGARRIRRDRRARGGDEGGPAGRGGRSSAGAPRCSRRWWWDVGRGRGRRERRKHGRVSLLGSVGARSLPEHTFFGARSSQIISM